MKEQTQTDNLDTVCKLASTWFIRNDNKFYSVDRPTVRLSKADVERIIIHRLAEELPDVELNSALLRAVFKRIIEERHTDRSQTIPVWSGASFCDPGTSDHVIWKRGAVSLNTWSRPDYRSQRINSSDYGPILELLAAMFSTQAEAEQLLDWIAWNLQNENDKPFWAPFFYSRSKGTGKSTLCRIFADLLGLENTTTLNNVVQLTGRFTATVLTSKLVICEEMAASCPTLRPLARSGSGGGR
jgi:hypothetical protein